MAKTEQISFDKNLTVQYLVKKSDEATPQASGISFKVVDCSKCKAELHRQIRQELIEEIDPEIHSLVCDLPNANSLENFISWWKQFKQKGE
jgi:hypothetical protein